MSPSGQPSADFCEGSLPFLTLVQRRGSHSAASLPDVGPFCRRGMLRQNDALDKGSARASAPVILPGVAWWGGSKGERKARN